MNSLRDHGLNGKAATPSTGDYPKVDRLRRLLGNDVLMLAWPLGTKGTRKKWGHLTTTKMADPAYLRTLEAGNIGIALGAKSNGLCSIDWDSEPWMAKFLDLNPALRKSLCTRGARGCNVWVRVIGDYPGTYVIKTLATPEHRKGENVGEWRGSTNSQTIISGQHPSGCHYSFLVEAKPVAIAFEDIVWPPGLQVRRTNGQPIAHSRHSPHSHTAPAVLSSAPKLPQVGRERVWAFDVSAFVPTQREQSDRLLWAMAGRVKTVEKQMKRPITSKERTTIFSEWWSLANPYVDPEKDGVAYLTKWLGAYERRNLPDDESALTAAWKAVQEEPLPPEATADYDFPLSAKVQQLVALCRQLQLVHGIEPFFLGSRDAGRLLSTPHRTVAYWLEILADEDGPYRILQKISSGSQAARRTNEYLYLRLMPP